MHIFPLLGRVCPCPLLVYLQQCHVAAPPLPSPATFPLPLRRFSSLLQAPPPRSTQISTPFEMDLPPDAIEWEQNQEQASPCGAGVAERYHSLLSSGWWLGKRLAIAGVAITSAPVVIPPLFVLSAISLAFSLPVTVLFAGYAATNKLMAYLLPPPRTQLLMEGPLGAGELGEAERYDLGGAWYAGADEGKLFDEMLEREESYPFVGDEENALKDMPREVEEMAEQAEEPILESPEEEGLEVDVLEEPMGATEVEVVDKSNKEPVEASEDTKRRSFAENGDNIFEEMPQKYMVTVDEVKEPVTAIPEGERPAAHAAEEPEGVIKVEVTDAEREELEPVEVPVRVAAAVVVPDTAVEYHQEGVVVDPSRPRSDAAPEIEKRIAPTIVPIDIKEVPEESVKTVEVCKPGEEDSDIDKIWKEIDALRVIVGYTESRLPSPAEELKALYKFTGVEPPSSLGESSDLPEIRSRLQFLKSVVGVK